MNAGLSFNGDIEDPRVHDSYDGSENVPSDESHVINHRLDNYFNYNQQAVN